MIDRREGLRAWAKGLYPTEAAAELLIRALSGRLINGPWIEPIGHDMYWFDAEQVSYGGYLSGGEQRILRIAASLANSSYAISLGDQLSGLDRENLSLVLAAVAHANGSHEHADIVIDAEAGVARNLGRLPGLHPWPADGERA